MDDLHEQRGLVKNSVKTVRLADIARDGEGCENFQGCFPATVIRERMGKEDVYKHKLKTVKFLKVTFDLII